MLAAEALGYSSVWIAEHHFNDYGLCPVPPVLAAFLAARSAAARCRTTRPSSPTGRTAAPASRKASR
jgi:alkanesulfonate monooxygenase SsuD/methylene tetrahydromethanopterin reductase-like flavin-dependent oxidoreductase (luciferase family)